ncbi:M56 family metallopeptidase [Hymenobacter ruber]
MTTLEQFVSPALTRALGWTLLHSLWQGALVAAVLAGALLLLRRQRAEVRYAASAGALGVVVALAGITFGLYFTSNPAQDVLLRPGTVKTQQLVPMKQAESSATGISVASKGAEKAVTTVTNAVQLRQAAAPAVSSVAHSARPAWLATGLRYFDKNLPLLVVAWLLGLLAMSLRMLGGLLYVQRLRNYRVRPLPALWQERLAALAARSGVKRPVALLESALVQVPLVVGHLRPVILLPLGTVAGLSPACLEAILAHELAHVLRRDYLVNLLQTVAEVLFFYHPAVWFMASCVRTERENCCDDTATALVGGDPLRLARALTALAEWSQSAVVPTAPRLALAAMNRPGALLMRVRRLVQRRPAAPTMAEGLMAGALVLGGLGLLGGSVALAGPLADTNHVAKPAAFDWQTGPTPPAKAAGVADTNKHTSTTTTTNTTTATSPGQPTEVRREITVIKDGAGPADEDLRNEDGRPPRRKREQRRVIINGQEMGPMPFAGNPGTVVVTKDKKGRLTDLVVNGQRVESAIGKPKKNKGQQVEIIQIAPAPDMRGFAFRTDGGDMERHMERNLRRKVEAEKEFNRNFNRNFQFDFPGMNGPMDGAFRMAPGGSVNRVYRLKTLNGGQDPETSRATLDALRGAERGLRTAAATKGLSATQRKEINRELEKVRVQLKQAESTASSSRQLRMNGDQDPEMRVHQKLMLEHNQLMQEHQQEIQERRQEIKERIRESQEEMQDLEQTDRDRAMAERDRDRADNDRLLAERDRRQADRDRAQADRDRRRADRDRDRADRDRKLNEGLIDQLQKDGLIKDKDNFQLRLTPTSMTVNGKDQSSKVRDKYLKLYAEANGRALSGNDVMVIRRNGRNDSSFNMSPGPRPPRPPRAPLAPLAAPPAPPMMDMPAPPAPPAPPRVDTEELRNELRKDGILGVTEKNLQFQLNNSGLTVNGKKQSDELAAKYRKLTGHAEDKKFNMSISTQE